jgi:uncharacterized protein
MDQACFPENMRRLAPDEKFRFRCHAGVPCFTDCCRQLDLALSPYDVLRLRAHLGLDADDFLQRHAQIEEDAASGFPHVFLAMEENEEGTCPFVSPQGCRVYAARPGACRTYPLARGAVRLPEGTCREVHVLLREPHCRGFEEGESMDVAAWNADQDLALYNAMNDETTAVLQHPRMRAGFTLDAEQVAACLLALFRADTFRARLLAGSLAPALTLTLTEEERRQVREDDIALLRTGIRWLRHVLFAD